MTVSFSDFIRLLAEYPSMTIAAILIFGAIFVNGWTDAPNSIATCISTRAIQPNKAIFLATVFNFLGVFVITMVNAKVAYTIFNIVDFNGDLGKSIVALCAAQFAIIIWATGAWYYGIPTSESHALIAGLTGSAIALHHGLSGVNFDEWLRVIYGLIGSTILGFLMGFLSSWLIKYYFFYRDRREVESFFRKGQISTAGAMAFLHGAQSGQKFMGVFLLALALGSGTGSINQFIIPVWLMIVCSLVLAYGTSKGGYRIIKSVGMGMVKLEKHEGFAADFGAAFIIFVSTIMGLPVSTTHTKMSSIMGVGISKRISNLNMSIARDIIMAWILTFPACGLIGFCITHVFIEIF